MLQVSNVSLNSTLFRGDSCRIRNDYLYAKNSYMLLFKKKLKTFST